jgi:hypothetical protein
LEPVVPLFVGTASSWEELLDLAQGRGDPAWVSNKVFSMFVASFTSTFWCTLYFSDAIQAGTCLSFCVRSVSCCAVCVLHVVCFAWPKYMGFYWFGIRAQIAYIKHRHKAFKL